MIKNNIEKKNPSDFKEPYEFRLLVGDNIICQRYFRINNFNKISLGSTELTDTIRTCARLIDNDLKSKTRVYMSYMAPYVFNNENEMRKWFSNPLNSHKAIVGENIILRDKDESEYMWDGTKLVKFDKKIFDSTFTSVLTDKDVVTYELAFYVNDKKVVSTLFEGVYPYYVRRNIDLSNARGKFEGEDLSRLTFESYVLNRLVYDKPDLIKKIVRKICDVCSVTDNNFYTLTENFINVEGKEISYPTNINSPQYLNSKYAKEIAKAKKYLSTLY